MNRVVVDTDVISFLLRNDSPAKKYESHLVGNEVIISFMTLAELRLWALVRQWDQEHRRRLDAHLRKFAVYPYDAELCSKWALVSYDARKKGRPIQTADAWIAATAVLHRLPLVTHNASDFRGVEKLEIISEPDSSSSH